MKKFTRFTSVFLVLAIVVSTFVPMVFAYQKNTGTRHELCTALSSQALSYYSENGFTYEEYAALEAGNESCLDTVNSEIFLQLHELMENTMTSSITYKQLTSYWPYTDRESNTSEATLFYSDVTSGSYNREHVWPKSRASFHQAGGGCDIHHLRPTNSSINSTRSNYTMGNVQEVCTSYERATYSGNTVLWYNGSYTGNGCQGLVEVNDNIKGDVARIFLYVYVRWEEANLFENDPSPKQGSNDSGGNNGYKVIYDLETLLEWCENDPVDTWEMSRNDACQAVQGNRNVFIDYPEFAWLMFDREMPTEMETPSGMAKESGAKYNITAVSNNDDYGTVTLDGRTVTANANVGYEVDGCTLTPSDAATVTRDGNIFKLSKITADCTLTVNFKAREAALITYHVPSGITADGVTNAYVGDSIALASVSGTPEDAPEGTVFYGWSTKSITDSTSKPAVYAAGSSYRITSAETAFFAVFSYDDNGTTHYLSNFCKHEATHEERTEPTCDKAGSVKAVCDECGYVVSSAPIAKLGHEHTVTTIEPTCSTKGYDQYLCTRCGDEYKKNYTPAVDHKDDDDNNACDFCGKEMNPTEPPVCPCEAYKDVAEDDWFHDAVVFAVENKLMNGISADEFAPNSSVTRAMLVTILYRNEGEPETEGLNNPFDDVPARQWYTDAVIWAADNGIVKGMSETTYEPETSITREQIATIMYRYVTGLGYDVTTADSEIVNEYPDSGNISAYATDAMRWAVSSGIINGMDGTLAPTATATRAQLATMLMRLIAWCNE